MKTRTTLLLIPMVFAFVHEKYNDKAIRKNKIVQTIGKIKLGGVIDGFIELYHSLLTLVLVNNDPRKATMNTTINEIINALHLTFIISLKS